MGFADRQHLESAYDLGKSVGLNKGHIHNYGQGEKAGGIRLAQTIVKLADKSSARRAPGDPEIRMLAMLSRPMQMAAHGEDKLFESSVIRPVVEFRRADPESSWELYNSADELSRKMDMNNLDNLLNFGPFKTIDRMMEAFDTLSMDGKFNTHLIMCDLIAAVDFEKTENDMVFTDCDINKSWRAKFSLRNYIALTYHQQTDVDVTLLGKPVELFDFTVENTELWKNRVIVMKPGDTVTFDKKTVKNKTLFNVQIGFVHDAQQVAAKRKANTSYSEHSHSTKPELDSPYQGVMLVSRKRVMQMPIPVETDRSGKLLEKFAKGVGALVIAECPKDWKGDPSKTRFEVGGPYDTERQGLMTLFVDVCKLLHQENMRKPPVPKPAPPPKPMEALPLMEPERASGRTAAKPSTNAKTFKVGDRVEGFFDGTDWYPGKVTKLNGDGSYNVQYDDGDSEQGVFPDFLKPLSAAPPVKPVSKPVTKPSSQKQGSKRKRRQEAPGPSYPTTDGATLEDLREEFKAVQAENFFSASEAAQLSKGTALSVSSEQGQWGNAEVVKVNKNTISIKWTDFPGEKKVDIKFADALQRLCKAPKCEMAQRHAIQLAAIEDHITKTERAAVGFDTAYVASEEADKCPICMDSPPNEPYKLQCCGVAMCLGCYDELRKHGGHGAGSGQRRCPNCRDTLPSLRGRQPRTSQVEEIAVPASKYPKLADESGSSSKQLEARMKTEKKQRADAERKLKEERERFQRELADSENIRRNLERSIDQKDRYTEELIKENGKLKQKMEGFLDQFEPEIRRLTEENEQLQIQLTSTLNRSTTPSLPGGLLLPTSSPSPDRK